MEIKDIIKNRRIELGLTMADVAKATEVSEGTVSRWESGNIANMRRSKIAALAKVLKLKPNIIMGWDDDSSTQDIPAGFEPLPQMVKIPLIGDIACGTPILAKQNIDDYVDCPALCKATFALQCHGDSMINARIFDGDIVFIHQQPQVENGEIAAVQIDDDGDYEATLKRFYKSDDKITLRAENPTFSDIVLTGEDMNRVHIAGKAVYFVSHVK